MKGEGINIDEGSKWDDYHDRSLCVFASFFANICQPKVVTKHRSPSSALLSVPATRKVPWVNADPSQFPSPPPLPLRKPHTSATPPLSLPFLLLPLLQLGHPSCDNCCTWTGGQPWLPYVTHTALPLKRQGLHCDPRGVEGNQEDLWLPFAPDASAPN